MAPKTDIGNFPWEILKAETLRSVAHDLGLSGGGGVPRKSLKREDIIVFVKDVTRRGLGPALAAEIAKDYEHTSAAPRPGTSPTSSRKPASYVSPTTPILTRTRKATLPSSTPISAPELQGDMVMEDDQEEDSDADAEGETDPDSVPASADTPARNTASEKKAYAIGQKGTKRVRMRLSDSEPVSTPATRSKAKSTARTLRDRIGGRVSDAEEEEDEAESEKEEEPRRSTRKRKRTGRRGAEPLANSGSEPEAMSQNSDGESEVEEKDESEGETGPGGLAQALNGRAGKTTSTKPRGRPPTKAARTTRKRATSAPTPVARRTRKTDNEPSVGGTRSRTKRVAVPAQSRTRTRTPKLTAKAQLLASASKPRGKPLGHPKSILSQPPNLLRNQSLKMKHIFDSVLMPVHSGYGDGFGEKRGKEVFEGVVLDIPGSRMRREGADVVIGYDGYRDERAAKHVDTGEGTSTRLDGRVGEREELSSLGGSNKENDFSFRDLNDVSMSANVSVNGDLPMRSGDRTGRDADGENEALGFDALVQMPAQGETGIQNNGSLGGQLGVNTMKPNVQETLLLDAQISIHGTQEPSQAETTSFIQSQSQIDTLSTSTSQPLAHVSPPLPDV